MTVLQGIILGILQGAAEFLPISSSGHLAIAQYLFGAQETSLLYTIMLHVATLASVCLFFRKRIAELFCVLGRFIIRKPAEGDKPKQIMILSILAATFVTGVIGLTLKDIVETLPIPFICINFFITAGLLIFSSVMAKRQQEKQAVQATQTTQTEGTVPLLKGLLIGLAQGVGVFPGISRSGITISAGLLAGIDRKTAGEFSFLLSIPAILGAFVLELRYLSELSQHVPLAPIVAGCVAAFVTGIVCLAFLMKLVQNGKLAWFAAYLLPLGIFGLLFL